MSDDDLTALARVVGMTSGDLIQTTAGNLDATWSGREVLIGCYPPAVIWWVDQLRTVRPRPPVHGPGVHRGAGNGAGYVCANEGKCDVSTEIPSSKAAASGFAAHIGGLDGEVRMRTYRDDDRGLTVHVPRADFLAAVAAECGVIIVDRAELPETAIAADSQHVDFSYGEMGHVEPIPVGIDADELIALGLALRASRAAPPADEAQVEAVSSALEDATHDWDTNQQRDDLARRLVERGVRVEVQP